MPEVTQAQMNTIYNGITTHAKPYITNPSGKNLAADPNASFSAEEIIDNGANSDIQFYTDQTKTAMSKKIVSLNVDNTITPKEQSVIDILNNNPQIKNNPKLKEMVTAIEANFKKFSYSDKDLDDLSEYLKKQTTDIRSLKVDIRVNTYDQNHKDVKNVNVYTENKWNNRGEFMGRQVIGMALDQNSIKNNLNKIKHQSYSQSFSLNHNKNPNATTGVIKSSIGVSQQKLSKQAEILNASIYSYPSQGSQAFLAIRNKDIINYIKNTNNTDMLIKISNDIKKLNNILQDVNLATKENDFIIENTAHLNSKEPHDGNWVKRKRELDNIGIMYNNMKIKSPDQLLNELSSFSIKLEQGGYKGQDLRDAKESIKLAEKELGQGNKQMALVYLQSAAAHLSRTDATLPSDKLGSKIEALVMYHINNSK